MYLCSDQTSIQTPKEKLCCPVCGNHNIGSSGFWSDIVNI